MHRRLKTASHLERMILHELHRHAVCEAVTAVTVQASPGGSGWELAGLYGPGGVVPAACRDIGAAIVQELRPQYDLLPESQLAPDYDLRFM